MLILNQNLIRDTFDGFKLATLGPAGTSSEYVAGKVLERLDIADKNIVLFPRYEEAYNDVVAGNSDAVIVANAYKDISTFYMDPSLELIGTLIEPTPAYGIATRSDFRMESSTMKSPIRIISHHAPIKKLEAYTQDRTSPFRGVEFEIIYSDSTSAAAGAVAANRADYCLTNAQAVEHYGLTFVSKTTGIDMVWSLFGREILFPLFANLKAA